MGGGAGGAYCGSAVLILSPTAWNRERRASLADLGSARTRIGAQQLQRRQNSLGTEEGFGLEKKKRSLVWKRRVGMQGAWYLASRTRRYHPLSLTAPAPATAEVDEMECEEMKLLNGSEKTIC